jgi:hypothetical protein
MARSPSISGRYSILADPVTRLISFLEFVEPPLGKPYRRGGGQL